MLNRLERFYCDSAANLVKKAAMLAEAEKVREEVNAKEEKPNPGQPISSEIQREPNLPLPPLLTPSALPVHDGPDHPL